MSTPAAPSTAGALNRQSMVREVLARAASRTPFDVVVIGGGITGAGTALDAALRGMSVLLVDRDDLASGTSSKSSKLVHGGLRYLQQGDVGLVREALRERKILMRNAPHLVTVMPFLLPIFAKDGLFPKRIARALGSALWAYDAAGGWRIGRLHRRVRRSKVTNLCPQLDPTKVAGGYLYYDAATDDARLTLDVARTAAANSAIVINHCPVEKIDVREGSVTAISLNLDGTTVRVTTRCVVNAAGVWAGNVDSLLSAPLSTPLPAVQIRPARGVHISLPWELVQNEVAVVLPVPGDRRSVFLIPSGPRDDGTFETAYVGTTDTDHHGPLDEPLCTADDVDYLLRAVNHSLGSRLETHHVLGVWAGLRPLVVPTDDHTPDRTADLSRRHRVDSSASGMVRVIGGKLTTYREMAEHTVDAVERVLDRRTQCTTKRTRILGRGTASAELTRDQIIDSVRHELAHTLIDVLCRRSRIHIDDRARSISTAESVASTMAAELGWSDQRTADEISAYIRLCEAEQMAQEDRA